MQAENSHHPSCVLVLMGVCGTGKTTVGKLLAKALDWPFYDGDDFQPHANIAKMSQGMALNDKDREPWLHALHDLLRGILEKKGRAVLACSVLKESYRHAMDAGLTGARYIHLKGPWKLIERRLKERKDHFYPPELLASQFEILEEPEGALVVDITPEPPVIVEAILKSLGFPAAVQAR